MVDHTIEVHLEAVSATNDTGHAAEASIIRRMAGVAACSEDEARKIYRAVVAMFTGEGD